jgi:hypothetical protein
MKAKKITRKDNEASREQDYKERKKNSGYRHLAYIPTVLSTVLHINNSLLSADTRKRNNQKVKDIRLPFVRLWICQNELGNHCPTIFQTPLCSFWRRPFKQQPGREQQLGQR